MLVLLVTGGKKMAADATWAMTPFTDAAAGSDSLGFFQQLLLAFRHVNPYSFASLGLACCIGPSVLGAAWYAVSLSLSSLLTIETHTHTLCGC